MTHGIVRTEKFGELGELNDNNGFFLLNVLANCFQILDYNLNVTQTSNDVLFKELQRQNKEYLEKIIKQNEEIIKLLKDGNK